MREGTTYRIGVGLEVERETFQIAIITKIRPEMTYTSSSRRKSRTNSSTS